MLHAGGGSRIRQSLATKTILNAVTTSVHMRHPVVSQHSIGTDCVGSQYALKKRRAWVTKSRFEPLHSVWVGESSVHRLFPPPPNSKHLLIMQNLIAEWRNLVHLFYSHFQTPLVFPVQLLGQHYDEEDRELFESHFSSIFWITYRSEFEPLLKMTSDVGWGCMLRCGQMMVAECLQRHRCTLSQLIINFSETSSRYVIDIYFLKVDSHLSHHHHCILFSTSPQS